MSDEKKEELMSLFICLTSIVILWMCFVCGLISGETELHILYVTFMIMFSFIKPHSKLGAVLCVIPLLTVWQVTGSNRLTMFAEVSEVFTYYLVGGFINRVFIKQTEDGHYMKFLGYQIFNIICGNTVWTIVLLILNTVNGYPFGSRDFFVAVIQRLSIIILHMLVCNKPLTNYFAERVAED